MQINQINLSKNFFADIKRTVSFQANHATQNRCDLRNNINSTFAKLSFQKKHLLDDEFRKWMKEKNIVKKTYENYYKTISEYRKDNPEYADKFRNLIFVVASAEMVASEDKIPELLIKQNALLLDKNRNPAYIFSVFYSFDGEAKNSTLSRIL